MSQFTPRRPRHVSRIAVAAASAGVATLSFGSLAVSAATGDGPQATGTVLDLNSGATASVDTDCPDTVQDYWHFVVTPNNGSITFEEITLNLSGTEIDFSGSEIIPNGSQTDNVFIAVPDGYTLESLVKAGTSATVSGDVQDSSKFNLSHVCEGTGGGTTTTTTGGGGTTSTTTGGGGTTTTTTGGGGTTTTTTGAGGTTSTTTGGNGGNTTVTTGSVAGETVTRGGGNTGSAQVQGTTQTRSAAATAVRSGARYTG